MITIKLEGQPSFHIKFTCLEKFRERQNAVSCKNFTASIVSLDKERLFSKKLIGLCLLLTQEIYSTRSELLKT